MKTATKTRLARWGNSLGVRIPKHVAERAGIDESATVELEAVPGKLTMIHVPKKKMTLRERIEGITKKNLNRDEGWLDMKPVGKEIW